MLAGTGPSIKRHFPFGLLPAVVVLLMLLPALVVAGPPPQRAAVHPLVWETIEAEGKAQVLVFLRAQADLSGAAALTTKEAKGRYVYETLRTVAGATQQDLRDALEAQKIEHQPFYIVNAIRLEADSLLVHSLTSRSDVARIVPNPKIKGIPDVAIETSEAVAPLAVEGNITRVNADDVWALGYTGQGIVVAGQDTGYEWDHPALKSQYRGWNGTTRAACAVPIPCSPAMTIGTAPIPWVASLAMTVRTTRSAWRQGPDGSAAAT
jgi:serine protease AprX